jgi:K+:H+ antiporter
MLSAAGVTSTLASRVMVGLLVIQDLAVVPMLVILPQLGNVSNLAGNVTRAILFAAAILGVIVLLGAWILPKLLRLVSGWGSRELFLIAIVAIGVGVGYATQMGGLSFALGAFVAGLVLSESEFSHQALSDVTPIRDIFGLLFFVSVGMLLDPAFVLSHSGQIAAVVLCTFLGKALIFGLLARAFGYVNMAPWIIGLGLSQIGEFSFVLARTGVTSGLLSKPAYDLALTSTVLTMAFAPLVYNLALPLGRAWRAWRKPVQPAARIELSDNIPHGHVIVAGYGRSGKAAARALECAGIPSVIVELSHSLFGCVGRDGFAAVWGDITSEDILHAAHIDTARVLLLTVPDLSTIHLAVQRARRLNPGIKMIARGAHASQIAELRKIGVDTVIQPEFEGGIEMVRQALIQCSGDHIATSRLLTGIRAEFYGTRDTIDGPERPEPREQPQGTGSTV